MTKLRFGKGNAKLDKRVATFSLPAGKTCPGAQDCKSMAIESGGKRTIKDGPKVKFRCFAASQEVLYRNTFNSRAFNLAELLKHKRNPSKMAELISGSLPPKAKYVRVHVSGDFFSQTYFSAWIQVANKHPDVLFYAYTKSLRFWVNRLGFIPRNLVLTASVGGKYDLLIHAHGLRYAQVVYSEAEAKKLGLAIDHDDTLAMGSGGSFGLLLHGTQPGGSKASKAMGVLRKAGKPGYSAKTVKGVKLPTLAKGAK